jgi:hypothetical protein
MSPDEWKPSPDVDAAVRQWMAAQGFVIDSTKYYFDEEVYAWRHEASGGSPTVWVARTVLEDYDAPTLLGAFDRLGLADRMRASPKARFLVVEEDGQILVAPWGHGPYTGA